MENAIASIMSAAAKNNIMVLAVPWIPIVCAIYLDNAGWSAIKSMPASGTRGISMAPPGVRVPTVIVSPLAKRGFVDHTIYDTTSILKLIESRLDLLPLAERDANANWLTDALELGQ
jgi:hypothetical protein